MVGCGNDHGEEMGFSGGVHGLWLLVKNKKGEVIEVDPSFSLMGGPSMVPLSYPRYGQEFERIYEAEDALGL